jgi:hypothetical protein
MGGARVAMELDQPEMTKEIMCMSEYAAKTTQCVALRGALADEK